MFEFKPLTSEEILPAIKRAFQLMADELGLKLRLEMVCWSILQGAVAVM